MVLAMLEQKWKAAEQAICKEQVVVMKISSLVRFRYGLSIIAIVFLIAGCGARESDAITAGNGTANMSKTMSWDKMPEMSIDLNQVYKAKFVTSKGSFIVRLYAKEAPVTVNNFVFLARERFYDGLTFHTIMESFMIQSGDPNGNGTGNPGYRIPDELDTDFKFEEGIIAMVTASGPNTGGSQFFIGTGPDAANLNREPNYTIFGKVEHGMDVVHAIAETPTKDNKPLEDVFIEKIIIEES